ncbi:MAG: glycosyltransferase family 2 protein [Bacilli bacterium]
MDKISLIIPCFNEQESINIFYDEVSKIEKSIDNVKFEYLFIDDGSTDNTLPIIKKIMKLNKDIHFISFSRNFGKEPGMYAGLCNATGDYAVVIDVDLQHDPKLIKDMYEILKTKDYDSVATKRTNRKGEPKIRSFFSNLYYKIMSKLTKIEVIDGETDYRMMTKQMYKNVIAMTEYNRFTKGIFSYVGFKTKWITQPNIKRVAGSTKWSFFNLFKYSLDGLTAFSTIPLIISSIIGLIFCLISFIMIVLIVVKTIIYGNPTDGWPSLICVIFMVSGIQLFCIGIIGWYLSKIYLETKKRPIYIIKETDKDVKENN